MEQNKYWLKFIITGNPKDYLKFNEECKQQGIRGGEGIAHNDRRPCNQRNNYKG